MKRTPLFLLLLLLTTTARPQFGIGTTWVYRGSSPYTDKVIGITTAPIVGQSGMAVIAYTDHGRAYGVVNGTAAIGHLTAEGWSVVASVGDRLPASHKAAGNAQWSGRWGTCYRDRYSGLGWGPTIGVICTWAITGNSADTTTMLAKYTLKADATAAATPIITKLIATDKAKDEERNSRTIYLGTTTIAWGDVDGDGDTDAAALVVWEYGGSGYEQRLYVFLNAGGTYAQAYAQRIALKGADTTFGRWLTIDADGVQAYRHNGHRSRWTIKHGRVEQAK